MYYVIQVKTGKENTTIDAIKRQFTISGSLGDFDVFSPYKKVLKKFKGGEMKEVTERCFPGYVFVETDKPTKLFHELYWVPEFTRLLGREGLTNNFVALNEVESRIIDILYSSNSKRITQISDIEVKEGQLVKVLDGPLLGLISRIIKVNLHKRIVIVEFMFAGQLVTTSVGINIVTPVDRK